MARDRGRLPLCGCLPAHLDLDGAASGVQPPPPHTGLSPGVPGSLEQAVGSSGAAEGALPHRSGVDTQLT